MTEGINQKKGLGNASKTLFLSVGVARFELATLCSQSRCANRTALHPETNFFLAERGGFEPPVPHKTVRRFSKPVD